MIKKSMDKSEVNGAVEQLPNGNILNGEVEQVCNGIRDDMEKPNNTLIFFVNGK